jgi:hypothetical protein
MTEAAWLGSPNPLWMAKRLRGRGTRRQYGLLSCGYALHTPDLGIRDSGRRMIAILAEELNAWSGDPALAGRTSLRLRADFPAEVEVRDVSRSSPLRLTEDAVRKLGPSGPLVDALLRHGTTGNWWWGEANEIGRIVRTTIRRAARGYVQAAMARSGRRTGRGHRETVFAQLPPRVRAEIHRALGTTSQFAIPRRYRETLLIALRRPLVATAETAMRDMVREIFGNPFRPWQVDPDWRTANFGAVLKIAEHIDRTGEFADLPILGDALEDAGCSDEAALTHCRGPGPHTLGCWVVDAILGR